MEGGPSSTSPFPLCQSESDITLVEDSPTYNTRSDGLRSHRTYLGYLDQRGEKIKVKLLGTVFLGNHFTNWLRELSYSNYYIFFQLFGMVLTGWILSWYFGGWQGQYLWIVFHVPICLHIYALLNMEIIYKLVWEFELWYLWYNWFVWHLCYMKLFDWHVMWVIAELVIFLLSLWFYGLLDAFHTDSLHSYERFTFFTYFFISFYFALQVIQIRIDIPVGTLGEYRSTFKDETFRLGVLKFNVFAVLGSSSFCLAVLCFKNLYNMMRYPECFVSLNCPVLAAMQRPDELSMQTSSMWEAQLNLNEISDADVTQILEFDPDLIGRNALELLRSPTTPEKRESVTEYIRAEGLTFMVSAPSSSRTMQKDRNEPSTIVFSKKTVGIASGRNLHQQSSSATCSNNNLTSINHDNEFNRRPPHQQSISTQQCISANPGVCFTSSCERTAQDDNQQISQPQGVHFAGKEDAPELATAETSRENFENSLGTLGSETMLIDDEFNESCLNVFAETRDSPLGKRKLDSCVWAEKSTYEEKRGPRMDERALEEDLKDFDSVSSPKKQKIMSPTHSSSQLSDSEVQDRIRSIGAHAKSRMRGEEFRVRPRTVVHRIENEVLVEKLGCVSKHNARRLQAWFERRAHILIPVYLFSLILGVAFYFLIPKTYSFFIFLLFFFLNAPFLVCLWCTLNMQVCRKLSNYFTCAFIEFWWTTFCWSWGFVNEWRFDPLFISIIVVWVALAPTFGYLDAMPHSIRSKWSRLFVVVHLFLSVLVLGYFVFQRPEEEEEDLMDWGLARVSRNSLVGTSLWNLMLYFIRSCYISVRYPKAFIIWQSKLVKEARERSLRNIYELYGNRARKLLEAVTPDLSRIPGLTTLGRIQESFRSRSNRPSSGTGEQENAYENTLTIPSSTRLTPSEETPHSDLTSSSALFQEDLSTPRTVSGEHSREVKNLFTPSHDTQSMEPVSSEGREFKI